jgi:ketosteroid isomerase-like protein
VTVVRKKTSDRAVVLGATMAGLLATRVLTETYRTITVIDRDARPEIGEHRRSVPHGRHLHAVQPRGPEILEELFSGFVAAVQAGALTGDGLGTLGLMLSEHRLRQVDVGRRGPFVSRAGALSLIIRFSQNVPAHRHIRDIDENWGVAMKKNSTGVIQVTNAEKLRDTIQDLFHAGNLDGIVSLFEPEGMLVVAPDQLAIGTEAIQKALAGLLAIGGRLEFKDKSFRQVGDIALRTHEWQVEGSDPHGNPLTLKGVAAAVLRRGEDGCWRLVIDNGCAFDETSA